MRDAPDAYAYVAQPCLLLLESVLEPHSAIYVAGPLDTGRLFYDAHPPGTPRGADGSLREANQARMTAFAAELRKSQPRPVIDPGPLRVASWDGALYGRFFLEVIERFVFESRFLDGWEYSRGATSEYVLCLAHGVICRDERGALLAPAHASTLIERAASRIERLGHDASRFRARVTALASA